MLPRAQAVTASVVVVLVSMFIVFRAETGSAQPQGSTIPALGATETPNPAATQPADTEVVIIGTIHAQHLRAPAYSPEVLREIALALRPSAILNELPLDQVEADGRPKSREYGNPEGWASDQVASRLRVPQVPFDRPDRDQFYARSRYFQRTRNVNSWLRKWLEELEKQDPNNLDLAFVRFMLETQQIQSCFWERPSPESINSDAFDKLMYLKHVKTPPLLLTVLNRSRTLTPELAEDFKFLQEEWVERNSIMAENIAKVARQHPGGRLVVLTGAEHRYALRDQLRRKEGVILKEYWEIVDLDLRKVASSPDRKEWEGRLAQLLRESGAVCGEYWEAVIQQDWDRAARLYPARGADQIKGEYSRTRPVAIIHIGETHTPRPDEGTTNPVTRCIVKYENGRMQETGMCTAWVNGKCVIVATLGDYRDISQDEASKTVTSQPSHK